LLQNWLDAKNKENAKITDNDIIDEIMLVFVINSYFFLVFYCFKLAGHESTASGMAWVIYELGINPQVFQKVREEADSVFGDNVDIEYDMINKLKYTDAVVKETLRLYPPGTIIGRDVAVDCEILGHKVSKGVGNSCFLV
jgi:cytochrome P450